MLDIKFNGRFESVSHYHVHSKLAREFRLAFSHRETVTRENKRNAKDFLMSVYSLVPQYLPILIVALGKHRIN